MRVNRRDFLTATAATGLAVAAPAGVFGLALADEQGAARRREQGAEAQRDPAVALAPVCLMDMAHDLFSVWQAPCRDGALAQGMGAVPVHSPSS